MAFKQGRVLNPSSFFAPVFFKLVSELEGVEGGDEDMRMSESEI